MPYYDKDTVRAVGEIDLLTYLKRTEPSELVPQGPGRFTMRAHDSLSISNGKWYWFSRGIGGRNALTFLIKVRGLSFTDAVGELLRHENITPAPTPLGGKQERRVFTPPKRAESNENAIAYLIKRGIREDVIDEQLASGAVYESIYTYRNSGRTQAQIVFLGYDEKGEARYANIRGIDGRFKGDAAGSDKRYPFGIKPKNPASTLLVFEGVIDLLSFVSILRHEQKDYSTMHMVSLGGVQPPGQEARLPPSLKRVLEAHTDIRRVELYLDSDFPGREAAGAIKAALEKDFEAIDAPPPKGKDYNDYLRISYSGQTRPPAGHER